MASTSLSPIKPPRSGKYGKETGILMAVIKAVSSTESTDQRDREKAKLEKEYRVSDQQLEMLICEKQEALSSVMEIFRELCIQIKQSRSSLNVVKSNLEQCKMLLHCRREELERLWLEGIEHKHALQLLTRIEKIRENCDAFTKSLAKKQYKQAVEIIMICQETWTDDLKLIEGLKDMHSDIHMKKDKMYEILKEELYDLIYTKSLANLMERRQGSGFQRSASGRRSSGRGRSSFNKLRRINYDFTPGTCTASQMGPDLETQQLDSSMSSIVDCMASLKEMPRFCEDLKTQLEEKLLHVVERASQHVIEFGDTNGMNETDSSLLIELLKVVFAQFRWIVRAYVQLVIFIQKATDQPISKKFMFDEDYIWSKVQLVLQTTLRIYFDVSDVKPDSGEGISPNNRSDFGNTASDMNAFFLRRKPQRQKKLPLFRFEHSMHGLNVKTYNKDREIEKHRFLVCKPSPRNIILIYSDVQEFVKEIETALQGKKCDLGKFMSNNVNKVFIQQVYKEISDAMEHAGKNVDCWREVISPEEAKKFKGNRPLFQSVVQIGQSLKDVIRLSKDLPSHREQLIKILDALLNTYRKTCQEAFQDIVQPDKDDKGKISATWAKDEDIERLLKSLPNWTKLQKGKFKRQETIDESPEDLTTQSLRESELLSGIFNGKIVLAHEIIGDSKILNQLAHLHESMEWFSETISEVANSFNVETMEDSNMTISVTKLVNLSSQFAALADMSLLVLHLEIRVHCFFYLLPMAQQSDFAPGIDQQNPDPEVLKLTKDINAIHHYLGSSLQRVKTKYVFEGIGHLIATILIGSAEQIQRINDNGVKRMCRNIYALQQTLCSLTKQPEHSLDKARQYYELFFHSPDELLDSVLEKGSQFKELEYMNALKLLVRSKPGINKEGSLNELLTRLSTVLGNVGVVV